MASILLNFISLNKKFMKKNIRYTFILFTLASLLFSCNPDDTNNDPQPTDDPRDKFEGSWLCNEQISGEVPTAFTVTISLNSANSSQIHLANFYQIGTAKKVYGVVANNSVSIPNQSVSKSLSIHGSGTMNNNSTQISWTYYVDSGADIDTCTAIFTK